MPFLSILWCFLRVKVHTGNTFYAPKELRDCTVHPYFPPSVSLLGFMSGAYLLFSLTYEFQIGVWMHLGMGSSAYQ